MPKVRTIDITGSAESVALAQAEIASVIRPDEEKSLTNSVVLMHIPADR